MQIAGIDHLLWFPEVGAVNLSDERVRRAIYDSFDHRDFWNQREISYQEMCIDHVVPRSAGGPDNAFNLVCSTARMNNVKGDAFDIVAVVPVLSLLRMRYGWRVVSALGAYREEGLWWRVDPKVIAREPRWCHDNGQGELERFLETNRVDFAEIFGEMDRSEWRKMAQAMEAHFDIGEVSTQRLIWAWKKVIRRERVRGD